MGIDKLLNNYKSIIECGLIERDLHTQLYLKCILQKYNEICFLLTTITNTWIYLFWVCILNHIHRQYLNNLLLTLYHIVSILYLILDLIICMCLYTCSSREDDGASLLLSHCLIICLMKHISSVCFYSFKIH